MGGLNHQFTINHIVLQFMKLNIPVTLGTQSRQMKLIIYNGELLPSSANMGNECIKSSYYILSSIVSDFKTPKHKFEFYGIIR